MKSTQTGSPFIDSSESGSWAASKSHQRCGSPEVRPRSCAFSKPLVESSMEQPLPPLPRRKKTVFKNLFFPKPLEVAFRQGQRISMKALRGETKKEVKRRRKQSPRLDTITLTKLCYGVIRDRRQQALRQNNENIANFYQGYMDSDFEHDMDYESIIGDDFEYQYENTDFESHGQDDLDYEVPYDIIQDIQQRMGQDDLVNQDDSQTMSLNNVIDMILKYMKTDKAYDTGVVTMNLIAALMAISYSIYSMVKLGGAGTVFFGTATCLTQIVNCVLNIFYVFKQRVQATYVTKVVDTFCRTIDNQLKKYMDTGKMVLEMADDTDFAKQVFDVWSKEDVVEPWNDIWKEFKTPDLMNQGWSWDVCIRAGSFLLSGILTIVCMCTGKKFDLSIVNNHKLRKAFDDNFADAKDIVTEGLWTFFGVAVGDSMKTIQELGAINDEVTQWMTIPDSEIYYNNSKYFQLVNLMKKVNDVLKMNISPKQNGASTLKQALVTKSLPLAEKLRRCTEKMEMNNIRQQTVIYHFYGNPACGKTEYVNKGLIPELSRETGDAPDTYSITFATEKDYFNEYKGQKFAVYDEFLSMRDKDQILSYLNNIGGTGFVNMPSAFTKMQPCAFNALFLIANLPWVKLLDRMTSNAALALYSRLKLFRVRNLKYSEIATFEGEDNGQNTNITHINRDMCAQKALPDWGHLIFEEVHINPETGKLIPKPDAQDPEKDVVWNTYTHKTLCKLIAKDMAEKQTAFLNAKLSIDKFSKFVSETLVKEEFVTPVGIPVGQVFEQSNRQNINILERIIRLHYQDLDFTTDELEKWVRSLSPKIPATMNIALIADELQHIKQFWSASTWQFVLGQIGVGLECNGPEDKYKFKLKSSTNREFRICVETDGPDKIKVLWVQSYDILQNQAMTGKFVCLLHGPTGAGKTQTAQELAQILKEHTKMPIIQFSGKPPQAQKHSVIYIADDSICYYEDWMKFYDEITTGSIVIATANVYVKPTWNFESWISFLPGIPYAKPIKVLKDMRGDKYTDKEEVPEGWFRRTGIEGILEYSAGKTVQIEEFLGMEIQVTSDFKRRLFIKDKYHLAPMEEIKRTLVNRTNLYFKRMAELIITRVNSVHELQIPPEANVKVWAPTWDDMFTMLKSSTNIMWNFFHKTEKQGIMISKDLKENSNIRFNPAMFLVPQRPETLEQALEVANNTYQRLRSASADYNVHIECKEFIVVGEGQYVRYYLKEDIQMPDCDYIFQQRGNLVTFTNSVFSFSFTVEDIARYYHMGMQYIQDKTYDDVVICLDVLNMLKMQILEQIPDVTTHINMMKTKEAKIEAIREIVNDGRSQMEMFLASPGWKVLKMGLGILATVVGVSGLSLALYQVCRPPVTPKATVVNNTIIQPASQTTIGKIDIRVELIDYETSLIKCMKVHPCGPTHTDEWQTAMLSRHELRGLMPIKCRYCNEFIYTYRELEEVYKYFKNKNNKLTWCYNTLAEEFNQDSDDEEFLSCDEAEDEEESNTSWDYSPQGKKSGGDRSRKKDSKRKGKRQTGEVVYRRAGAGSSHANDPGETWIVTNPHTGVRSTVVYHSKSKNVGGYTTSNRETPVKRTTAVSGGSQGINTLEPITVSDDMTREACIKYLRQACVQVTCEGSSLHGIAIKGDYILTPFHLLNTYCAVYGEENWKNARVTIACDEGQFLAVPYTHRNLCDVLLLKVIAPTEKWYEHAKKTGLNPNWTQKKDITSWFVTEDGYDNFKAVELLRFLPKDSLDSLAGTANFIHYNEYNGCVKDGKNFVGKAALIVYASTGTMRTRYGDCGFPLIVDDNRAGKRRIMGMHIAAYKSTGIPFSTIVSEDMLIEMLQESPLQLQSVSNQIITLTELNEADKDKLGLPDQRIVMPSNLIQRIDECAQPDKLPKPELIKDLSIVGFDSKMGFSPKAERPYRLTPWNSLITEFPNEMTNAVMQLNEVRDKSKLVMMYDVNGQPTRQSIIWTQVAKYSDPWTWDQKRQDLIEEASALLMPYYLDTYCRESFRTCTLLEVINGIMKPSDPYYSCMVNMELKSAAGPYWQLFGVTQKQQFMKDIGGPNKTVYTIDDTPAGRVLKGLYEDKFACADAYRVMLPAKDCLKAEKVSETKAKEGNTRLFVSVDTVDIMFTRRVAGTFMASFKKNRMQGHCQTGIDPHMDFTPLYERLRRIGQNGHAGDFSSFDKHLLKPVIKQSFENMKNMMLSNWKDKYISKDLVPHLVDRLFDDFCDTLSVCSGTLYVKHKGNPSGNVLTCVMNSMINDLMVMSCLTYLMDQQKFRPKDKTKWIYENVDWLNLGDDLIVVCSHEAEQYFPFSKFSKAMWDLFSIKMTHPSKEEVNVPDMEPIEQLSFLSRTFSKYGKNHMVIFPKLKQKTITSLLYWTSDLTDKQYNENLEDACSEAILWDEPFYDGVRSVIQKAKTMCPGINVMPRSYHYARSLLESAITTGYAPFDSFRESTDRNKVPFGPSDVEVLRLEGKVKPTRAMNQQELKQAVVRLLDKQKIEKTEWLSASQKDAFWREHNATLNKHLDIYFGKSVSAYASIPSENIVTGDLYDELGTAAIVRQYVLGRQLFIDKRQHVVILISPAQEKDIMKDSAMTSYETKDYGPVYYREYNGTNPNYQGKLFLLGASQQNYFRENPVSACNKYNDILQLLKLPACVVKGMVTISTVAEFQPFKSVFTPITKAIGENMILVQSMFAIMAMYTTSEPTVVWMNPKDYQELEQNSMWRVIDCVKPSGEVAKVRVRKYTGCRPWHNYTFALNDSLCTLDRTPSQDDVCAAYTCIYPTEDENGLAVLNPPGEQGSKAEFLKAHLDGFSYAVTQRGKMIGWDFTECNQLQMFLAYHQKEIIATFRKLAQNGESQMMQEEEARELLNDSDSDYSSDSSDPEEFEAIYRQLCIDKAFTYRYHDHCDFCKELKDGKYDYLAPEIQALYRNVHFSVDKGYRDEDTDWVRWFYWLPDIYDEEEQRIRDEDREANMTIPVKRLIRSILRYDIQTVKDHGLPDDRVPFHAKSFGNPELLEKRGVLWRVPYKFMTDYDNAQFDTDFFTHQIELARLNKANADKAKRQPACNGQSQASVPPPATASAAHPTPTEGLAVQDMPITISNQSAGGSLPMSVNFLRSHVSEVGLLRGGITVDLLTMVRNNWFNFEPPLQYTQDTPINSVLRSYSYGPNLFNPWWALYANLHERFTGDIEIKFIINGAQIFRGKLLIGVMPRETMVPTILRLQQFSSHLINVNEDGAYGFKLSFLHNEKNFWETVDDLRGFRETVTLMSFIELINPFENPGSTVVIQAQTRPGSNFIMAFPKMVEIKNGSLDDEFFMVTGSTMQELVSFIRGKPFDRQMSIALDGQYYPDPEIHQVKDELDDTTSNAFLTVREVFNQVPRIVQIIPGTKDQKGNYFAHATNDSTDWSMLGFTGGNTQIMLMLGVIPEKFDNSEISQYLTAQLTENTTPVTHAAVRIWAQNHFKNSYVLKTAYTTISRVLNIRSTDDTSTTKDFQEGYLKQYNTDFDVYLIGHSRGYTIILNHLGVFDAGFTKSGDFSFAGRGHPSGAPKGDKYTTTCLVRVGLGNVSLATLVWTTLAEYQADLKILPDTRAKVMLTDTLVPLVNNASNLPSLSGSALSSMISTWFDSRLEDNQVVDIALKNPDFNTIVMTIRYQKSIRTFLLNPSFANVTPDYTLAYNGTRVNDLIVANIATKVISQTITPTSVINWVPRNAQGRKLAVNGVIQAGMAMPMALGMGGGMLQGLGSGMEATSNALFSMQMQERNQKFQKGLFDQQLTQDLNIANMRNDTARWTVQQQLQNQLELANINFTNTQKLNLQQNEFQRELSAQNYEQNSELSYQQFRQNSQLQDQNWASALQYQADLLDLRGISTTQGQVNMGRAESRSGLGASSTGLWQAAGRGDTLQDALNNYRATGVTNSQSGQLHSMVFTNSQLRQNAAGGSFLPSNDSIHAAGTPNATIVADQAAHGAGHEIQSSDVTGPTPSTSLDVEAKTPSSSSPVYDESISLGQQGELAKSLNEGSAKILPIAPATMNAPSVGPPITTSV